MNTTYYNNSISPTDTFDIITKLKFIGNIKEGEKISVKSLSIQPKGLLTSIVRMFNQESREDTASFISSTCIRSFEIINSRLSTNKVSDKLFLQNTIIDIQKASIGIKNIQETYVFDRRFYCFMEMTLQSINSQLEELYQQHPTLFIYPLNNTLIHAHDVQEYATQSMSIDGQIINPAVSL